MTNGPKRASPEELAARAQQQRELLEGQDTEVLARARQMLAELGLAVERDSGAALECLAELRQQEALPPELLAARAAALALRLLLPSEVGSSSVGQQELAAALRGIESELRLPHRAAAQVRMVLMRELDLVRLEEEVLRLAAPQLERRDQPLAEGAPWAAEVDRWLNDPPSHARGPDFELAVGGWRQAWGELIRLVRTNSPKLLFAADDQQRAAQYRQFGHRLEALWKARVGDPVAGAAPDSPEALRGTEEEILNTISDMVDYCYTGWDQRIRQLEDRTPVVVASASGSGTTLEGLRVAEEFGRRVVVQESCPRLAARAGLSAELAANVHVQEAALAVCSELFPLGIPFEAFGDDWATEMFEGILEDASARQEVFWGPAGQALSQLVRASQGRFRDLTPDDRGGIFEGLLDLYQEAVIEDPLIRVEGGASAEALHLLGQELEERNRAAFDSKSPAQRRESITPLLRELQRRYGLQVRVAGSAQFTAEEALCRIHPDVASRLRLIKFREAQEKISSTATELAKKLEADLATRTFEEDPKLQKLLRLRLQEALAQLAAVDAPEGQRRYDERLRDDVAGVVREWAAVEARYQGQVLQGLCMGEEGLTQFGAQVWMAILGVGDLHGDDGPLSGFLDWLRRERLNILQRSVVDPWKRLFAPQIAAQFLSHPALMVALHRDGICAEALVRLKPSDLALGGEHALPLEEILSVPSLIGETLEDTVGALMLQMMEEGDLTLNQIILEGNELRKRLGWSLNEGRLLCTALGGEFDLVDLLKIPNDGFAALQRAVALPSVRLMLDRIIALREAGEVVPARHVKAILRGFQALDTADLARAADRVRDIAPYRLLLSGNLSLSELAAMTPEEAQRINSLEHTLVDMIVLAELPLDQALRIQARGPDRFFQIESLASVLGITNLERRFEVLELLIEMPEQEFRNVRVRLRDASIAILLEQGDPEVVIRLLPGMSEEAFSRLRNMLQADEDQSFLSRLFQLRTLEPAELELILCERMVGFARLLETMSYLTSPRLLQVMMERPEVMREVLLLPPDDWDILDPLVNSGLWQLISLGWLSVKRAIALSEEEQQTVFDLADNLALQQVLIGSARDRQAAGTPGSEQTLEAVMARLLALPREQQLRILSLLEDENLVAFLRATASSPEPYAAMEPQAFAALRDLLGSTRGRALLEQSARLREHTTVSSAPELERFKQRLYEPRNALGYQAASLGLLAPEQLITLSDSAFERLLERLNHPAIEGMIRDWSPESGRSDSFLDGLVDLRAEDFEELIEKLRRPEALEELTQSNTSLEEFLRR